MILLEVTFHDLIQLGCNRHGKLKVARLIGGRWRKGIRTDVVKVILDFLILRALIPFLRPINRLSTLMRAFTNNFEYVFSGL